MSSLFFSHEQRTNGPWVKLQSEPKVFTALMHELGVRGAQAIEIFDDTVDFDKLGEIYGFVYLFRMMGDCNHLFTEEYAPVENPNIYFANQVVNNACETLAVLNIALNNSQMEIGADLREFKEITKDLPPSTKGLEILNHQSFRLMHNSIARHPEDVLIVEANGECSATIDDTAEKYHHVVYVPMNGEVLQLDGTYPHPVSVGTYTDRKKWHNAACEVIRTRTHEFHAKQIHFVLLAITKDQLGIKKERVKECIYLKRIVEARLKELDSKWKVDIGLPKGEEKEVCERDDVKKEIENLNSNGNDINKLIQLRKNWIGEIHVLQEFIDRENKMKQIEKERQTFDYGPFIREYISILQERGELEYLLNQADDRFF